MPAHAAGAGPIGPVFAVHGIEVPPPRSPRPFRCSHADGSHTEIATERTAEGSPIATLRRVDAGGDVVFSGRRIDDDGGPSRWPQIACREDGAVLAVWTLERGDREIFARAFDADGLPSGPKWSVAGPFADGELETLRLVAADGTTGFVVWELHVDQPEHHYPAAEYWVSPIDVARPSANPATFFGRESERTEGLGVTSVDADGNLLVTWVVGIWYVQPFEIFGAVVDRFGTRLGESFAVRQVAKGEVTDHFTVASAAGEFVAYWRSRWHGGMVARRIAVDTEAVPTTTTTTLPGPHVPIGFSQPATLAPMGPRHDPLDDTRTALAAQGAARWAVFSEGPTYARNDVHAYTLATHGRSIAWTQTGGRTWGRLENLGYATGPAAFATTETGTTVLCEFRYHPETDGYETTMTRTAGDGSEVSRAAVDVGLSAGEDRRVRDLAIATDRNGVWLALVGIADWRAPDEAPSDEDRYLAVVRSDNDGRDWTFDATIDIGDSRLRSGLAIAADGAGTWLAAWGDRDLWVAVSRDDGRSWTDPVRAVGDVWSDNCALRGRKLALATDTHGAWRIVFATRHLHADSTGVDADVFSVHSAAPGVAWSGPFEVNRTASIDRADDRDVALASDGAGSWLAAWVTHDPVGRGAGADGDVVVSASAGASSLWSAPELVDDASIGDAAAAESPSLAADGHGRWGVAWGERDFTDSAYLESADPGDVRVLFATTGRSCGDGRIDDDEECDDGNATDGDGCDLNCLATACGNGIVTNGESCDDGNGNPYDGCTNACLPAVCGDGLPHATAEACDDGNDSPYDRCLPSCMPPLCGDGVVNGYEECEDGNGDDTDACTTSCTFARCGDGLVHAGVEECDRNRHPDGRPCTRQCTFARCGDGIVSSNEVCDDGNDIDDDLCTNDCGRPVMDWDATEFERKELCGWVPTCGDSIADGRILASDALHVLAASVGRSVDACPTNACDTDANGTVAASDALAVLRHAVGDPVRLECPNGIELVFSLLSPETLGGLQLEVDLPAPLQPTYSDHRAQSCRPLRDGVVVAAGLPTPETANYGAISLAGFTGPTELFACRFESPAPVNTCDLVVTLRDASTTQLSPPTQPVRIAIH